MKPTSTYGTDDCARQFACEALKQCKHTNPAWHPLDESGACVDCITETVHSIVEEVKAAERERCAGLREEVVRLKGALATAYSHGHTDGINHFAPHLPDWIVAIRAGGDE